MWADVETFQQKKNNSANLKTLQQLTSLAQGTNTVKSLTTVCGLASLPGSISKLKFYILEGT